MECAFKETLSKGMTLKQNGAEVIVEDIKADAFERSIGAVLALLVEKIMKDAKELAFTADWLLDLLEKDFLALQDYVAAVRGENEAQKEAGKKN
jgi:hypothetical protein